MFIQFWMVQRLTREIHDLRKKSSDLQVRITQYQNYANKLGQSSVLGADRLAALPPDLVSRVALFSQFAEQNSSMMASNHLMNMKACGLVPQGLTPQQQYQIEFSAYNQFKEQARKAMKQQEIAKLNEIEKEIQLEQNEIENQIKMKQEMLESHKKGLEDDIKNAFKS